MMKSIAVLAGLSMVTVAAFGGEGAIRRSAQRVPGHYVVVLDSNADMGAVASSLRSLNSARVHHRYEKGIKGFALELSEADALQLSRDARVQFVEEDASIASAQQGVSWALDRIDQRALPLDSSFQASGDGSGVSVYIVDTGIRADHVDFGGRVAAGFSAFDDAVGSGDCNGHGTHVAGLVGGTYFGVAKSATLVPVRVLDCSGVGTTSSVIAGLDWVINDHLSSGRPAVVNMSISGAGSSALDQEVNLVFNSGMTTVVAAGNGNTDACTASPARVATAITVGATNASDERASYSNYGACVDLFAPGSGVASDWYSTTSAVSTSSGTSESSPIVAGVAAAWLSQYPNASPTAVSQSIISGATLDAITGLTATSANRLLFSAVGALDATTLGADQLLSDPGFDYGTTFWSADICTVINQTGCPGLVDDLFQLQSFNSRSGKSHASLGGRKTSVNLLSEAVTIPTTPRRAELNFYLWVVSQGQKHTAVDFMNVEIRDKNGAVLETIGSFSNLNECATYEQRRIDVSRYRGATIRIAFTSTANHGQPTAFLVDDVSLQIWP